MMTRTGKRAVVACCILLCLGLLCPAAAETGGGERVLRVAFPESPGLTEVGQDGRPTGIVIDYLNEISKYTNWRYEYVETDGENLMSDTAAGKFDLVGGTYYDPSLEEIYAYPDYDMGSSRAVLYARRTDNSLKSYNLQSFSGKTIGVFNRAAEKIRRLEEFLSINDIHCTIRPYSYDQMPEGTLYAFLESGEVDLILGNDIEIIPQSRSVASFNAQPYYIVTMSDRQDILGELNQALKTILDVDPDFAQKRYDAHFPDLRSSDIQFNEEELTYITRKKTATVAIVGNWHPFYCIDNLSDHHRGFLPDLLEQITGVTGLNFSFVFAENYADATKLVQEGKADLLASFFDSEEDATGQGLVLTTPYISINNMLIKHKSVSYPAEGLTAAILDGRRLPSELSAAKIVHYAQPLEGVQAVNRGEVDFYYGLAPSIETATQEHHLANVVPVTLVSGANDICFALRRPAAPELLTILNKAILSLPTAQRESLLDRNLVSIGEVSLTPTDILYAYPVASIVVLGLFFLLVVLVMLILARSRIRNSLMENELRRAEAESRAKGEFLSRMSHEIRTPMNAIAGLADLTCMLPDVPQEVARNLQKLRASSQYLLSLINDILDMSRIDSGMMTTTAESFSLSRMAREIDGMLRVQADQRQLSFSLTLDVRHDWLVGDEIRLRQVLINLLSNALKFTPPGGEVRLLVEERSAGDTSAEIHFSVRDTGVGISPENQSKIFGAFEQVRSNLSKSEGTGLGLPISSSIVRLMGGELQLRSELGRGSEFFFSLTLPFGQQEQEHSELPRSLEGIRALMAEDNDLNAEIAAELLGMRGIETERAADGREAVDAYLNHAPGHYDVILMDLQMPNKNGLEAAREIRASNRADAKTIPIIAMTANSFREDTEAAAAAGMDGFIPKPVDCNVLFEVLRESITAPASRRRPSGPA